METALQLNIHLPNRPGTLARMTDMLRAAEVNIEALFCEKESDITLVHVIVNDPETAKIVLKEINEVTATEVLAVRIKNKPGAIAHIARMCAGAGINIGHIYATSLGKEAMVYLSVDDPEKAKKLLK
ncbi:hypothetical protein A3A67_02120 [Candidatus Peribacteria bacterium RIFCSPLOWO2_01_FULL_51_18]|nr:MAG: hypothetical protein A3A67_02120 [Candidatus Peribacteria bacterium RIFCSPLOWO2_01_FULL_51_18]